MALHSPSKAQKPAKIAKVDDESVNDNIAKKMKLVKDRHEEKRTESEEASVNKQGLTKQQNVPRSSTDEFDWNVDNEVLFLTAMTGHKPVGINRHFEMLCILDKFQSALNREIDSQVIWDRLDTMYNMERLHEVESIPFPNDELEFTLPDEEFSELMKDRPKPQDINLTVEVVPPPQPEIVVETKRELKRELQVYKGMKDIKKDKEVPKPEPVPEVVKELKETKKEEKESPVVVAPPSKRNRPSTPQDKRSSNAKESKKDSKSTPTSKERRQSHSEKDSKSTPKSRTPTTKKEPSAKEEKSELRKDRVKELSTSGSSKRSTRGSITDSTSTKSASPITTGNLKRKRT